MFVFAQALMTGLSSAVNPVATLAQVGLGIALWDGVMSRRQRDIYEKYAKQGRNPVEEEHLSEQGFGDPANFLPMEITKESLPKQQYWAAGKYFLSDKERADLLAFLQGQRIQNAWGAEALMSDKVMIEDTTEDGQLIFSVGLKYKVPEDVIRAVINVWVDIQWFRKITAERLKDPELADKEIREWFFGKQK